MIYNGLTYKGTSLQTEKVYFDLHSGYWEPADVRGVDNVAPGIPGRYRRNRVKDHRIIELRGWIRGHGSTASERQLDWAATTTAILALFDPTGAAGTLAVVSPYLGLPAGSKSISAYPLNAVGGAVESEMTYQLWSLQLEAVGNPPDWA